MCLNKYNLWQIKTVCDGVVADVSQLVFPGERAGQPGGDGHGAAENCRQVAQQRRMRVINLVFISVFVIFWCYQHGNGFDVNTWIYKEKIRDYNIYI